MDEGPSPMDGTGKTDHGMALNESLLGRDYSQNGEQAHILHILDTIGLKTGHLVDLGAGDGYTMSNTRALLERGWSGTLWDGDPKGAKDVRKQWIDIGTVPYMVIPKQPIDFLNLDIDGNDYWILQEALKTMGVVNSSLPSLVVCEINPIFQRDEAVVMPYNESHVWQGDTYYGMSLAACEQLAHGFGYTLCYLHAGINAFLLRNDHAEAHPELLKPIEYKVKRDHKPHPPEKEWQYLS